MLFIFLRDPFPLMVAGRADIDYYIENARNLEWSGTLTGGAILVEDHIFIIHNHITPSYKVVG